MQFWVTYRVYYVIYGLVELTKHFQKDCPSTLRDLIQSPRYYSYEYHLHNLYVPDVVAYVNPEVPTQPHCGWQLVKTSKNLVVADFIYL